MGCYFSASLQYNYIFIDQKKNKIVCSEDLNIDLEDDNVSCLSFCLFRSGWFCLSMIELGNLEICKWHAYTSIVRLSILLYLFMLIFPLLVFWLVTSLILAVLNDHI